MRAGGAWRAWIAAFAWACSACASRERAADAPVPEPEPVVLEPRIEPASEPAAAEPARVPAAPAPRATGARLRAWHLAAIPDRLTLLVPGQAPNLARAADALALDLADAALAGLLPGAWCTLDATLTVTEPGVYGFRIVGGGDAQAYVDDVRLPDADRVAAGAEVELDAGAHAVALEVRTGAELAAAALEWRPPGADEFEPIPAAALAPPDEPTALAPGAKRALRLRPRVRPGDGAPLQRPPPQFEIAPSLASFATSQIAGLASRPDALAVALDDGTLRAILRREEVPGAGASVATIAAGLDAPCGVAAVGARWFVQQAGELTEVVDIDGDRVADEYRCALAWREIAGAELRPRALANAGAGLLALLDDPRDGSTLAVQVALDARSATIVGRLPLPSGPLSLAAQGETLVGDVGWNDGGGPRVSALEGGTLSTVGRFPHGASGARAVPLARIESGPFAGQWLVGGVAPGSIERLFLEQVEGRTQGCVFRFAGGVGKELTAAALDADGALVFAAIDPERRVASLERWSERGDPPFDLRAVRARSDGFEIELTEPLAPGFGTEPAGWVAEALEPSSPAPRRALAVVAARADLGRRRVKLEIAGLRARSIVHVRAIAPLRSIEGSEPWTAEAWYALERIPSEAAEPDSEAPDHGASETAPPRSGWIEPFSRAELAALAAAESGRAILASAGEWRDFVLELDWRARPGASAVLRYRVGSASAGLSYALTDERSRASLDPLRMAGACRDIAPAVVAASAPSGAWQCARIVARGARVEHWLNGAKVLELDLAGDEWRRRARALDPAGDAVPGRIVLEADGGGVEVRSLALRPLD